MSAAPDVHLTLPYSLYRIPIEDPWARRPKPIICVSLAKNSQLRTGMRTQALIREARRQLAQDATVAMQMAIWPEMRTPLTMSAIITCRTRARRDDDGAVMALYPARDAIAKVLGIDDSEIRIGDIDFRQGELEETEITLKGGKRFERVMGKVSGKRLTYSMAFP